MKIALCQTSMFWTIEENLDHIISRALAVPIINVNSANGVNSASLSSLGGSVFLKNGQVVFQEVKDSEVLKIVEV